MRSENAIASSRPSRTKIVVICHDADRDDAQAIIDKSAPIGWRAVGEIRLLEAGSRPRFRAKEGGTEREVAQNPELLRRTLDQIAPPQQAARIIIVGTVRLYPDLQQSDPRAPIRLATTKQLSEVLPNVLSTAGLDWLSHLMRSLEHYHVEIDQPRVDAWRYQFQVFDGAWMAEALLKLLDFWPSSQVSETLFRVPGQTTPSTDNDIHDWLSSYDHIAFNKADSGDSSAMISRLAKIRIGKMLATKRTDFAKHVTESSRPTNILLLEDCLVTGTETVRLLDALPTEKLHEHRIDMKFAVGTQSGCKRLGLYLKQRGLTNARVLLPPDAIMQNFTPAGLAVQDTGLFAENGDLLHPAEHIIHGIQLRAKGHFNRSERDNITSLCQSICGPLLRLHLQRAEWPPESIEEVADRWKLGFAGLGLLLALAHGIPKPTLPLFWVEGPISVEHFSYRFRADWIPLFPRPLQEHMSTVAASAGP
jgi:hypothetical protein